MSERKTKESDAAASHEVENRVEFTVEGRRRILISNGDKPGKSVLNASASSSSSFSKSTGSTMDDNEERGADFARLPGSEIHLSNDVKEEAFEALYKSYNSLAVEYRKLGERQRRLRSHRNEYRNMVKELTKAERDDVSDKIERLKGVIAKLTTDLHTITEERDMLREMQSKYDERSLEKMTQSRIDRMVTSYAGDMMESSVSQGFGEELRVLAHKLEVASTEREKLRSENEELRKKCEDVNSGVAYRQAIREPSSENKSLSKSQQDVIADNKQIKMTKDLEAESRRRLAAEKEVEELKVCLANLQQKVQAAKCDTISNTLSQSAVVSSPSVRVPGRQDVVMVGANSHQVMESRLLEANEALKSELSEVQRARVQLESHMNDLLLRQQEAEKDLSLSEKKLKERESEVVDLRNQLKRFEARESSLVQEVSVLKTRLDVEHDINVSAHNDLLASQRECEVHKANVMSLETQNTKFKQLLDQKEKLNTTLESQLRNSKQKFAQETSKSKHAEELARLQSRLQFTLLELEKAKSEASSLRDDVKSLRYKMAITPAHRSSNSSSRDDNQELESMLKEVYELQQDSDVIKQLLEQQRPLVLTTFQERAAKKGVYTYHIPQSLTSSAPAALELRAKENEKVPAATKFPSTLADLPLLSSSTSERSLGPEARRPPISRKVTTSTQKRPHSDSDIERRLNGVSGSSGRAALSGLVTPPGGTHFVTPPTTAMRRHYENLPQLREEKVSQPRAQTDKFKQTGV